MKTETPSIDQNAGASAGAAAPAGIGGARGNSVVPLADRFEIQASQRFEGTDRPTPDCFRAQRTGQAQGEYLAIATGISPLARAEMLPQIKSITRSGLLSLLDWGIVDWPSNERRFVLIFARPPAPPIMKRMDEIRPPMGEEELVRAILTPIQAVLSDTAGRGLYHGAIRPTNIFYNPAGNGAAMLGECVSTPAGFLQPVICETVERALAEPAGRGPGTIADDIYALGVTAAILAMGQQALRTLPDAQQIELKIERGSYAAIVGNARIPSGLIEPLRGLLGDDPASRWTLDDLSKWMAGRRQNPRQPTLARRGQRPIQFGDAEIWNARSLATAMSRNVPMAFKLIESGEVDRWLRRIAGDAACAERVANALAGTGAHGRGSTIFEERLVARVCQALDPASPIRYRGRSVMPMGIGGALAQTVASGQPVQYLAELIIGQFPAFWYNSQAEQLGEAAQALKAFEKQKSLAEKTGLGFGIERCLYEMVPAAPCLSEMVGRLFAQSPASLLQALETAAANSAKRPTAPLDRHIAAFLAARDRSIGEPVLNALTASNSECDRHLALLNILSGIQRRHGLAELPKLAEWFRGLMGGVIDRYHSRKTRKHVQGEVALAAQRGDLSQLRELVDDPKIIGRDLSGFRQAQALYASVADELSRSNELANNRTEIERSVGRETAAVVSAGVALLLAAGIVFLEMGL